MTLVLHSKKYSVRTDNQESHSALNGSLSTYDSYIVGNRYIVSVHIISSRATDTSVGPSSV